MPSLVRKLLICATAQGLVLQPINGRNQPSTSPPLSISYGDGAISPSLKHHDSSHGAEGLESHGLIGVLNLSSGKYAISITQRKQVAQIRGKPIYVITDVSFVPLSSQSDAQRSIDQARSKLKTGKAGAGSDTDTDYDTDEDTSTVGSHHDHDTLPHTPLEIAENADGPQTPGSLAKGSTVAEDVIKARGNYGRFAERWFSKAGWTASGRAKLGMSRSEDNLAREQRKQGLGAISQDEPAAVDDEGTQTNTKDASLEGAAATAEQTVAGAIVKSLTPRILQSLRILLASESFYFSYDYDLSRRLGDHSPEASTIPLHKQSDPLYFWNQHLAQPVIDSGHHPFVLPIIQGFVGQRAFTIAQSPNDENDKVVVSVDSTDDVIEMLDQSKNKVESKDFATSTEDESTSNVSESRDFLLTLISRRSVKRAGLRYLRRGVDDQGNVANNVETEQILSDKLWDESVKVYSFAQVRGSIPLFFSQSPYSFKPIPITYGSEMTNHTAFNQHFRNLISRYGKVYAISLVDQHGTEKAIGELYKHHIEMTNDGDQPSFGFQGPEEAKNTWHQRQLQFRWFDFHHECRGLNFQNVQGLVDSLTPFLSTTGSTELVNSQTTQRQAGIIRTNCMDCLDRTNVVQSAIAGNMLRDQLQSFGFKIDLTHDPQTKWFNTIWADNGDAVSRQYAGTAALKGDYTRTRKRNWKGAINDFSLTLGRYYTNIFSDYFLQTTIDFVLGLGDEAIWADFETDMVTGDHALDMSRARHAAIDRCVKVVLGHSESDPADFSGEEDLISGWTLATPVHRDTTSPPVEACVLLLTDQALYAVRFDMATEKVGAVDRVALANVTGLRRGVYITSALGATHLDPARNVGFVVRYSTAGGVRRVNTRSLDAGDEKPTVTEGGEKVLAFKALAACKGEESEEEVIRAVTSEVQRAMKRVSEDAPEIVEEDVIDVEEARRSTGYLESLGYSLRRLVWA